MKHYNYQKNEKEKMKWDIERQTRHEKLRRKKEALEIV